MILKSDIAEAPRRRGRLRHPSCGRAITMAQRHGEPPARARETPMPASDTHGLADPGRGRAEAPRDPPLALAATARRHATTQWRPTTAAAFAVVDQSVATASQGGTSFSHCVTTNASTRLHHRLSSPKQRQSDTCCAEGATRRVARAQRPPLTELPSAYIFWPGVLMSVLLVSVYASLAVVSRQPL